MGLNPQTRILACGTAIAAMLLAAGCGTSTTKVIDSDTAAPVIEKQIRVSGMPSAKSIECPQTEPKTGRTFACHVSVQDGSSYEMTIRIDKAGAKHPLLTVTSSKLLIVGPSNVEPLIDEQIEENGAPRAKSITCQHVVATVGQTFTCKATLANGQVLTDSVRILKLSGTAPPEFGIKALSLE